MQQGSKCPFNRLLFIGHFGGLQLGIHFLGSWYIAPTTRGTRNDGIFNNLRSMLSLLLCNGLQNGFHWCARVLALRGMLSLFLCRVNQNPIHSWMMDRTNAMICCFRQVFSFTVSEGEYWLGNPDTQTKASMDGGKGR